MLRERNPAVVVRRAVAVVPGRRGSIQPLVITCDATFTKRHVRRPVVSVMLRLQRRLATVKTLPMSGARSARLGSAREAPRSGFWRLVRSVVGAAFAPLANPVADIPQSSGRAGSGQRFDHTIARNDLTDYGRRE